MRLPHLLSCLSLLAAPQAHAAQDYDNCKGFIDSLPATVSTPGVWCLRSDLSTALVSGSAIYINADDVTIDCNEFKLGGLAAGVSTNMIGIQSYNRDNATVRRCNVRGFRFGMLLEGGSGHVVEDNRLSGNLAVGIQVQANRALVQRNQVYDTGGRPASSTSYGIYAAGDVIGNTVAGVFATANPTFPYGIFVPDTGSGSGGEVRDNRVRGLAPSGGGGGTGIQVQAPGYSVSGNRVSSTPQIAGSGVMGDGPTSSFCAGNTMANFASPLSQCQDLGGNGSH